MVALLDVDTSTGNQRPKGFKNLLSSSKTIPGSTVQVLFFSSKSTILLKYFELSITSERLTVWPHCEVPPPRGRIEILLLRQKLTALITSSLDLGINTAKGWIW